MNDNFAPRIAISVGIVFGLLAATNGLYRGLDLFEIVAWRLMPSFIFASGLTWLSISFIGRIIGETVESEAVVQLNREPETTGQEIDLTSEPESDLLKAAGEKTKQESFQDLQIPNA